MRFAARQVGRLLGDLVAYGARSGRWWLPCTVLAVVVVAVVATTTSKVVVPVAMYTLL